MQIRYEIEPEGEAMCSIVILELRLGVYGKHMKYKKESESPFNVLRKADIRVLA